MWWSVSGGASGSRPEFEHYRYSHPSARIQKSPGKWMRRGRHLSRNRHYANFWERNVTFCHMADRNAEERKDGRHDHSHAG